MLEIEGGVFELRKASHVKFVSPAARFEALET